MIPFSYTGKISVEGGIAPDLFIRRLGEKASSLDARKIRVDENGISFRGGFFRCVNNRNRLIGITWAKVGSESCEGSLSIGYTITFYDQLLCSAIGAALLGFIPSLYNHYRGALWEGTILALIYFVLFASVLLVSGLNSFSKILKQSAGIEE